LRISASTCSSPERMSARIVVLQRTHGYYDSQPRGKRIPRAEGEHVTGLALTS
jgi:hypothetical protein